MEEWTWLHSTQRNLRQGSNSEIQPIRWKVLNIEENTVLLLAEDCLMMSGYSAGTSEEYLGRSKIASEQIMNL